MPKYEMRYNLGGGFGGTEFQDWEDCHAETFEGAEEEAYEAACDLYESYNGLHGLLTVEELMEEEGIDDEEEGYLIWLDQRESWLDYEIREKKDV